MQPLNISTNDITINLHEVCWSGEGERFSWEFVPVKRGTYQNDGIDLVIAAIKPKTPRGERRQFARVVLELDKYEMDNIIAGLIEHLYFYSKRDKLKELIEKATKALDDGAD